MRNNDSVFQEQYTISCSYLQYKIAILNQRNSFLRYRFRCHDCAHGSYQIGKAGQSLDRFCDGVLMVAILASFLAPFVASPWSQEIELASLVAPP